MPHTGIQPRGYLEPELAMWDFVKRLYTDWVGQSRIEMAQEIQRRNQQIRRRYGEGQSIPELGKIYRLSNTRIHQILHETAP